MSANIVINQYYFEYLASVLIVIGYYVYIIMAKYTNQIIKNLPLVICSIWRWQSLYSCESILYNELFDFSTLSNWFLMYIFFDALLRCMLHLSYFARRSQHNSPTGANACSFSNRYVRAEFSQEKKSSLRF